MSAFRVELREGDFGYFDLEWRPLLSREKALEGWVPQYFYPLIFEGISILSWEGPQGQEAVWFTGEDQIYLAGCVQDLGEVERKIVTRKISIWAMEKLGAIVNGGSSRLPSILEESVKRGLIEEWLGDAAGGLVWKPAAMAGHLPFLVETLACNRSALKVGPSGDVQLSVVNPRTGERVIIDHGICLDDFRTICPLAGEPGLYLCRAGHKASFLALYDASTGTVYVGEGENDSWAAPHYFRSLDKEIYFHLLQYEAALKDYFLRSSNRLAAIFRNPPHLGHQLYNEVGGIDVLLQASRGARRPPLALILGGAEGEIYGPTDALFPEWRGSVAYYGEDWISRVYNQRLCALRLTDEYVGEGVRARIVARACASELVAEDRSLASALKAAGTPIVIIGLRVENRTLGDIPKFIIALADRIHDHWPDAVLVIDGHNAKRPGSSEVYKSAIACTRDPYEYEREIVTEIKSHCDKTGLTLIDLVGSVMERSVFWSALATAFVAPWGAGLAKYRWLGNCPGVILSNSWNIQYRSDFDIYFDPNIMAKPSRVIVIDSDRVKDITDVSSLIMPHPSDQPAEGAMNFDVDIEDVVDALKDILSYQGASEKLDA